MSSPEHKCRMGRQLSRPNALVDASVAPRGRRKRRIAGARPWQNVAIPTQAEALKDDLHDVAGGRKSRGAVSLWAGAAGIAVAAAGVGWFGERLPAPDVPSAEPVRHERPYGTRSNVDQSEVALRRTRGFYSRRRCARGAWSPDGTILTTQFLNEYAVSRDGQRFLVQVPDTTGDSLRIIVTTNWASSIPGTSR